MGMVLYVLSELHAASFGAEFPSLMLVPSRVGVGGAESVDSCQDFDRWGCGLSAEVAKNIVLAGVGHVAIADDTPCSSAPFGNFLVAADADPSSSVAEASARTLQAMNPLVSVVSVPGSAKALAKECSSPNEVSSLAPYDLILATDLTFTEALQLDAKCTEMGKKLFVSTVNGPISFTWVNLQKHTYTVKQSADAGAKATPPVEQLADYSSLAADLSTPHASPTKRTHPL
eukprot:gene9754-7629_t